MNPLTLACAALAAILLLPAAPAQALINKSFVSSTGNDMNDCSFAAPCASFQRAHDQLVSGGLIACLDSGFFGSATISRSVTIDCAGTAAAAFAGFVVNGDNIVVTIRNLTEASAGIGIDFQNGAALFVENCNIRDGNRLSTPALAIRFRPTAPGSQMVVSDTIISNNGIAPSTGGGIQVAPQAGGSAGVVLNRVQFGFNVTAMALQSFNGPIGAVMTDSVVSSSRSNGILTTAGQVLNFTIRNSRLVNNVGNAIQSSGANSLVRLDETTITGNEIGVSAISGGVVQSFKNNRIVGNGSDGTPLAAVPGGATQ